MCGAVVQVPDGVVPVRLRRDLRVSAHVSDSCGSYCAATGCRPLLCAGDVRLNWRSGSKPSAEVKAGDVISCAGKGRVEVKELVLTKKGKYSLKLVRFV